MIFNKLTKYIAIIPFIALISSQAVAVNLADRIGLGYSNAFLSGDLDSVQVKYSPTNSLSIVGALGINTRDDDSTFGFLAKAHKIVFHETNLNFYLGGHLAFISQEFTFAGNSDTESGTEVAVLAGVEFFIPGLENVGITFETGFGISTLGEGITFRTVALHPLQAGMIFYF